MTTVLGVVGVLLVLFVVAAVALRDEAVLVDAPPDRADLALPDRGPVTAGDLARLRFGMAARGYRMAQVDAVLDRVAGELLERDEQLAALRGEVDRLRAQGPVEAPAGAYERPAPVGSGPRAGSGAPVAVEGVPAGHNGSVLIAAEQTVLETEPPVEHVPDSGAGAEPLPGVRTLPGASPPDPVPFPEPVHTDEPVRAPDQPDGPGAPVTTGAPSTGLPSTGGTSTGGAAGRVLHLARRLQTRLAPSRRAG